MVIIPFIDLFFFPSNKNCRHKFLSSYESECPQILYRLQRVKHYCVKKKQVSVIYIAMFFCFFFSFFFLFPSVTQM